jgi:hypothetical protein
MIGYEHEMQHLPGTPEGNRRVGAARFSKNEVEGRGLGSYGLRWKPVADSCVQGNELPGFIKGWGFHGWHCEY